MKINQIPLHLRPRERAYAHGVPSLSESELIAILLRSGRKGKSALELAQDLLSSCEGDLSSWREWDVVSLSKKGIGRVQAITLLSALELGMRIHLQNKSPLHLEEALLHVSSRIRHERNEFFYLICLDYRNHCIGLPILLGKGTRYHVLVDPREVLNKAIQREAGRIVLVHNHPSLSVEPSPQDLVLTKQILEGGSWVDIELYDHVIVTQKEMASMRAGGYFP